MTTPWPPKLGGSRSVWETREGSPGDEEEGK
jgi:hypothetical protein